MTSAAHQRGDAPEVTDGRRRFCQFAIGGMGVVAAGTVGYPILSFLRLPKSLTPEESMKVRLSDLAEGSAIWGEQMGRQVVVLKIGGKIRAFDGACTHLGCIVQWDPASQTFKCPCHGAVFDEAGDPISGPTNIPLRQLTVTISAGVLKIA
jgi:cytochrome b6-f complex iron-sulfur subunit